MLAMAASSISLPLLLVGSRYRIIVPLVLRWLPICRSIRVESWRNVHRRQFLEQQLGRVRDVYLRDLRLVIAQPAIECLLLEIGDGRHSAAVTNGN